MKRLKEIDLILQLLLMTASLFAFFVGIEWLIISYFFIGGWQMISAIVHQLWKRAEWLQTFRTFHLFLSVLLLIGLPLGVTAYLLLFSSPIIAISYCFFCWKEWRAICFRNLIHLK